MIKKVDDQERVILLKKILIFISSFINPFVYVTFSIFYFVIYVAIPN